MDHFRRIKSQIWMYDKVRVKKRQIFEVNQDTGRIKTKRPENPPKKVLGASQDPWAPPTSPPGSETGFGLLFAFWAGLEAFLADFCTRNWQYLYHFLGLIKHTIIIRHYLEATLLFSELGGRLFTHFWRRISYF